MIIKNGSVLLDTFVFSEADIKINNERITDIGALNPNDDDYIDATGMYVLPGFIDTHIHGANGARFSDDNPDINAITSFEATKGVTCIAATTGSSEFSDLLRQFDNIVSAIRNGTSGAKIAGIHSEGPFLNRRFKGAMTERNILTPCMDKVKHMFDACKGYLKIITVAPEVENAKVLIEYAVANGALASIGHTNALFSESENGVHWGATQATHTFNAMRPYNHREPGVLGSVLTNPKVKCEIICDFVHLHPKTIELIYRLKGADNINMVSDSGHSAGTELTEFIVDGEMRYVKDGVVTLADGTIAGSTKTLLEGVQNLVGLGIPLEDVSRMVSYNPARTLGIANETGSISIGKYADIVVLDKDMQVRFTFVNGKQVVY
ncbi:MAG: N-acetylglucosamine-6-phosphate deacetylase [Firmicutes bacterium HGW-Firmicutes-21]|nr:MAG: N-acetylglucosamine-6-phosphate deacetylase [Firmicutes bacterium HGW-Firmicutes-21]